MENKEVTMELILSVFKNYSDKKRIKEIKWKHMKYYHS